MGSVSRRDFVKFAGIMALAPYELIFSQSPQAALASSSAQVRYLLNSAPRGGYGNVNEVVRTPPGSVEILDPAKNSVTTIKLDYFGHTFLQYPKNLSLVATFEQYGKRGSLIDLKGSSEKLLIEADDNNTFMGHAIYAPTKNIVLSTEQNHKSGLGEIVVRDPSNLRQLEKFSSNGLRPHECRYSESDKAIVVVNDFGPSNISFIGVENGKVTKTIELDPNSRTHFNHFDINQDGWILAGSRKPSAYAALINPEGKLFRLNHPDIKMSGILSVAFLGDSDLVAATYPEGNRVAVWNFKSQKLISQIELHGPKGISFLENNHKAKLTQFLVSLEHERGLRKISLLDNYKVSVDVEYKDFAGTGAHLVRLYI